MGEQEFADKPQIERIPSDNGVRKKGAISKRSASQCASAPLRDRYIKNSRYGKKASRGAKSIPPQKQQTITIMPNPAQILKKQFQKSIGLPFQQVLPETEIIKALQEEKILWRNPLFNPIVTIWAFLSQVIDSDKSVVA